MAEPLQQRRDDLAAETHGGTHAQLTRGRALAQFPHVVQGLDDAFHTGMALFVEALALEGQRGAARGADEQAGAQLVFQFCTLRLTAERPMPRRSPALAKLPSAATAMKATTPA